MSDGAAAVVAPFDAAAAAYDATFTDTDLGRRLRSIAWSWMDRAFGPGDRVLELGCGTGVDAVHLADRGIAVVATDASREMCRIADTRVITRDANDLVRVVALDLDVVGEPGWAEVLGGAVDGVLSDFGALNCVRDRPRLLRALGQVVRPGGRMVLVAMGPLCLTEIAWHVVHGERRVATRRWHAGARAAVGDGAAIRVWYPSARRVAREAAPWFRVERRGGIGVVMPPSGLSEAMERRGGLLRALAPVERRLGGTRLGAWCGDHWVLELIRRDA